jgi:hypothetical protein
MVREPSSLGPDFTTISYISVLDRNAPVAPGGLAFWPWLSRLPQALAGRWRGGTTTDCRRWWKMLRRNVAVIAATGGDSAPKAARTGGADGWRRSGLALRDDFEQCKLADKLFAVPVVTASPHGRPIRCTFIPSYFAPSLAITWDRNPWRSRALQASARP